MTDPGRKKVPFLHALQTKYALTYLALITAVLILLNTYPLIASQDMVFQSKHNSLENQAPVLSSSLGGADTLTAEGVAQAMEVLGKPNLNRVLVTDPAGLILYDSLGELTLYRYALFGEISGALRGQKVLRSEFHDGAFHSYAAVPITYRNMTIGSVYLYERDAGQGALLLSVQSTIRSISILVCALAILFSLLFSNVMTRRIGNLLAAMGIVREGEYSHRVNMPGQDELALLADEFNSLTDRLQVTEEARRRFVSDASHELKTPLASIRLLTDSILQSPEIDPTLTREFVSDIGEQADRLTRISEKLLNLTRLDAAPEQEIIPVNVAQVIETVAHLLTPLAQTAQVTLELALSPHCLVLATGDDLYQITFNLIENAIKYNHPGGRVMVFLSGTGEQVTLRVEDTGVGIPEEHQSKIFDRFYRVDKARSRAAGGTGLGLSIVRDTAQQHGGTVTVSRREPEGSVFTVTFPAAQEVEP